MKRVIILVITWFVVPALSNAQKANPDALPELVRKAYGCYLNDPDDAIVLAEVALKDAHAARDSFHEGYVYYILTKAYWVKANYKLSTEYGFKALRIFQDSQHYQQLSETRLALARNLVELGNLIKAREFIDAAWRSAIQHQDVRLQAASYRERSYLLTELNELDSALHCSDKALALYKEIGDSLEMSVLHGRKSRIYYHRGHFTTSRDLAYEGLILDSLVGNRRGLGISYYQVAQNEQALGNRDNAIAHIKQSIRINEDIGNLTWQIRAHELLAQLYLEASQPALAAAELQKVNQFKDDLYNSEKNGQIQEMQALHDLEAKQNTIKLLEQENALKEQQVKNQRLFVAFLLVAVLFLMLLTFVLTRMRSVQHRTNRDLANQNIAIEQQKMAIQMQAENLKQIDEVKTKLFSVISHDLRGPISNLQSLLELFTKKLMTADEFINLSGKLKENLNVTQRTLENLLNWSLSQMGGIKTETSKVDILACVEEACTLMEEFAARKNITLKRSVDDSIKVWVDRNQLQVVLRNLIHNAIKFSGFDDTIEITATRGTKYCRISVKDSGIGMTHQEIASIVDSGQYFSKHGTGQEKGTGLGLLLCKEFITRNGGELTIESSFGAGTEVSFNLLLAEHATSPQLAITS